MKKFEVVLQIAINTSDKMEAEKILYNVFEEVRKKEREFKDIKVSLIEEYCNRW
jgi:hypothetical protein